LRYFEKHLLELLGFALNLSVDADSGEAVAADVEYQYQIEHGPVRLNPLPDTAATLVVSGASLLALDQDALQSEQALKDAKRLMRQVLAFYLDGKPLKSRELFR
jgi:DNA repair protein RecO (recombination protein O)